MAVLLAIVLSKQWFSISPTGESFFFFLFRLFYLSFYLFSYSHICYPPVRWQNRYFLEHEILSVQLQLSQSLSSFSSIDRLCSPLLSFRTANPFRIADARVSGEHSWIVSFLRLYFHILFLKSLVFMKFKQFKQ